MKKLFLLPVLFVLLTFNAAQSQINGSQVTVAEEKFKTIDLLFKKYIDSGWIKGITANITIDGKTVYNKAFGNQIGRPFKTDDILRIASQTKAITAVAVMMLLDEGKLSLNDPISKYLPAF